MTWRDAMVKLDQREAIVDWTHLAGNEGVCVTRLAPAGKARFGDQVVDVITDGRLIDKDTVVVVTEVSGNRVLVFPAEQNT